MALIMGLEGLRGNRLLGVRGLGLIPPARATTLAGLYGTFDIIKRHPLLILTGIIAGGWWAASKLDGPKGSADAWGSQRMAQSRARALSGAQQTKIGSVTVVRDGRRVYTMRNGKVRTDRTHDDEATARHDYKATIDYYAEP
jgi:hypothetical protein